LTEMDREQYPEAKKVRQWLREKEQAGMSFESQLADQLRANGLIEEDQKSALDSINASRNRFAHPTGENASPEHALQTFTEAVTHFLGKRNFSVEGEINTLFMHLNLPNFFPDASSEGITKVVREEMALIEKFGHVRLIPRLVKLAESGSHPGASNAENFLAGLLSTGEKWPIRHVQNQAITRTKNFRKDAHGYLLTLLAAQTQLMRFDDETAVERLDKALAEFCSDPDEDPDKDTNRHPIWMYLGMLEEFTGEEIESRFKRTVQAVVNRYWYLPEIYEGLSHDFLHREILVNLLRYLDNPGLGSDRALVTCLWGADVEIAEWGGGEVCYAIVTALLNEDFTQEVSSVRGGYFMSLPNIRAAAKTYVQQHKPEELERLLLGAVPVDRSNEGARLFRRKRMAHLRAPGPQV
jgi:hypothetical protein